MKTKRRELLKGAAAIACGAVGPGVMSGVIASPASQGSRQAPLVASDGEAITATRAGRVAGYVRNAIIRSRAFPTPTTRLEPIASCRP